MLYTMLSDKQTSNRICSLLVTHLGGNHTPLILINSQAGTGHGELDDEDDEQHNHVEEQHHLE